LDWKRVKTRGLILFDIVRNILAALIACAKQDGQVRGHIPYIVEGGVSIRQYKTTL
jgi:hypothetical protein